MGRTCAFFDIDGTVFRSSLLIELVNYLVEQGHFPTEAQDRYKRELYAWQNREGSFEKYIDAVVETFMEHIRGLPFADLAEAGQVVIAAHQHHTYRYTRDLITTLKRDGFYLVAISQSPKSILDAFCGELGFDKVYGRFYELGPSDRLTGVVVDEHLIANKANIVRRVVEREHLTLAGSIGVGDTEGDIPMLDLVENPICFNPNRALYEYAKLQDWRIVVERKDVIYEL